MNNLVTAGGLLGRIKESARLEVMGRVVGVTGPVVRARGVNAVVGQQVDLWASNGGAPIAAEVIGIDEDQVLMMAFGGLEGVGPGCDVSAPDGDTKALVGDELLGRIVDGMGQPLDAKPMPELVQRRSLRGRVPQPLERARIKEPISTGVRAIDGMLSVGQGQRLGIFAGAGVGKSTLLSMISRHSSADVCVVALIGERGREVREFTEDAISIDNRERTVVVAVTGDQAPLTRIRGALYATTITEHFRAQGKNVLFLLDSLTRYAMALREVGLAAGELPASKGYPPSVFVELARILERAGNDRNGSTTGIYTVLVEGDDLSDPVADSSRALLDGHIVLSRDLAARGVFPAIDMLGSTSRLMGQIVTEQQRNAARRAISILSDYRSAEDLIRIGAYRRGSDVGIDRAIAFMPQLDQFISQEVTDSSSFEQAFNALLKLLSRAKGEN